MARLPCHHRAVSDRGDEGQVDRLRAHLEAAHRIAGLGSWEVDLASAATWWSPDADDILGPAPGDAGVERLLEVVHAGDRAQLAQLHADAVRHGRPYEIDLRIVLPDGLRHVHLEVVVERADDGTPACLVGTFQDVTDRMALARRQAVTESRRRELLHRLVRAGEAARSQLAADLHDGPVQVLTATSMRLEVLGLTSDPRPAWLDDALPVVREVSAQLREVLYELHPRLHDGTDQGVAADLAHLADTVLPGMPVAVRVHDREPAREHALAVHAVVQEALWDVREHDSADTLAIDVHGDADAIRVVVDGAGGEGPLLTRMGLLGVRHRCEAQGGTAGLDSGGRVLRCSLPVGGAGSTAA